MRNPTNSDLELFRSALERAFRLALVEQPDRLAYLKRIRTEMSEVLQGAAVERGDAVSEMSFRAGLAASVAAVLDQLEAESRSK